MNGQGRPIDERENGRGATWNGSRSRGRLLACLLLTFAALVGFERDATAADRQYRLHIAWGGSAPRRWQGRIFLQQGSLQNVSPLGFDPDAPGSYIEQAQRILIAPSLPHRYDGLSCLLKADDADTLTIELVPDDEPDEIRRLTIPVRQLSTEPQVLKLDDASSQLTVKRATGDLLQFE